MPCIPTSVPYRLATLSASPASSPVLSVSVDLEVWSVILDNMLDIPPPCLRSPYRKQCSNLLASLPPPDTMVNTPRPTRAEATDVANAVLDGVDGILLGAETLRGKYPVETIKTVSSICRCGAGMWEALQGGARGRGDKI